MMIDINLPFSEYISLTRSIIKDSRPDLQLPGQNNQIILDANTPFENYPTSAHKNADGKYKAGILMVHGLLDSPFSYREFIPALTAQGFLCKSILLPGHGTKPEDLLTVSYQQWIDAVNYGVNNLRKESAKIFIIGYSTGAALALYQALTNKDIAGIILLAPAIQIKTPKYLVYAYHFLKTKLHLSHSEWVNKEKEINYAKYISIPFNAVKQVITLTEKVKKLNQHQTLTCPLFMCMNIEDETISSQAALNFFCENKSEKNKLLLYATNKRTEKDGRILTRATEYLNLQIKCFSHIGLPFSIDNTHYGVDGDYIYASSLKDKHIIYGAYNTVTAKIFNAMNKLKLSKKQFRALSYNPDFDFMLKQIIEFIKRC